MIQIGDISFIGNMNKIVICRFNERGSGGNVAILQKIDEADELNIDETGCFNLECHGSLITIPKENIYFYGDIDLTNDDDLEIVIRKHLVDEDLHHSWIPSNFDYSKGTGNKKLSYPTANPVKYMQYCHVRLGKPKKVIAYKIKEKLL